MTLPALETVGVRALVAPRTLRLSDEQRATVEWSDGPLMVRAGVGTGKTTFIVERVAHVPAADPTLVPENVLVLTYSVKVAGRLVERFESPLGMDAASRPWIHHVHSFGHWRRRS